jgi:hypothetical protein
MVGFFSWDYLSISPEYLLWGPFTVEQNQAVLEMLEEIHKNGERRI